MAAMYTIFAADIGATNCRFALFQANRDDPGKPMLSLLREKWLAGKDYPDFRQALKTLRAIWEDDKDGPIPPDDPAPAIAVLAPAGPIEGDACRISNLPWIIRAQDVRNELGIADVRLLNDFAAQAHACLIPDHIDAAPILPGVAVPGAPTAVAGAGTGFGQALILDSDNPPSSPAQSAAGAEPHSRVPLALMRARILPSRCIKAPSW